MKKQYLNPMMQVTLCDMQDILTASGNVLWQPEGYGDVVDW